MPIAGTRRTMTGGWGNPKLDLKDPSLVLYLPLWYPDSETTGSPIISKDINRHSCTVTGAIWTPQGRAFDGIDDRIVLNANVTKGLAAVTVLAWVKPNDLSVSQSFVEDYTANGDSSIGLKLLDVAGTGTWRAYIGIDGNAAARASFSGTTSTLAYGTVYCIAGTWEPNLVSIFVNGVADGTFAYTSATLEPVVTENTVIGSYQDADNKEPVSGIIGEVLVYNRALTLAEIQHIYNSTKWRYQ